MAFILYKFGSQLDALGRQVSGPMTYSKKAIQYGPYCMKEMYIFIHLLVMEFQ